jgi:putative membrane protein
MLLAHRLLLAQMHWNDHMDRDGLAWWIPVMWLAFVAVVVLGAIVLLRSTTSNRISVPTPPSSAARSILTERYARGELDTQELRERMAALDDVERDAP